MHIRILRGSIKNYSIRNINSIYINCITYTNYKIYMYSR